MSLFKLDPAQEALQARMAESFTLTLTGAQIAQAQFALLALHGESRDPKALALANTLRAIIGAEKHNGL